MEIMEKKFSLYLDMVRFVAAIFVVIAHYVQYGILSSPVSHYIPEVGREAVITFFVLSGYVIAYTTEVKNQSLQEYVAARCARIYSVAFPVLLIAFITVYLSSKISMVVPQDTFQISKTYIYLPFHLFFSGDLWTLSQTPPWLPQYWSLDFEVWYYVFFSAIYYFTGLRRAAITLVVFIIMGYKLWLLLPVWLSGVYLYHWSKASSFSVTSARIGWVATLFLFVAYKWFDLDIYLRILGNDIWPFPNINLGSADRYLADYCVCILIFLNFSFARNMDIFNLQRFESAVRTMSSYTFSLYLVHGLVLKCWTHFFPQASPSVSYVVTLTAAIALATYVIGSLTEHRKKKIQRNLELTFQAIGRFNVVRRITGHTTN